MLVLITLQTKNSCEPILMAQRNIYTTVRHSPPTPSNSLAYCECVLTKFSPLRAAFQYGIKMSEGRKTRRFKETNEKAELDRQWKKISAVSSDKQTSTWLTLAFTLVQDSMVGENHCYTLFVLDHREEEENGGWWVSAFLLLDHPEHRNCCIFQSTVFKEMLLVIYCALFCFRVDVKRPKY